MVVNSKLIVERLLGVELFMGQEDLVWLFMRLGF